jgi:hypothetical protein
VAWGLFFPTGRYTVTATHAGGDAAQVFLTITRGELSETVAQFGVEPDPAIVLQPGETVTRTVSVSGGDGGAGGAVTQSAGGRTPTDRRARTASAAKRVAARPAEFVGPRALPTPRPPQPSPARATSPQPAAGARSVAGPQPAARPQPDRRPNGR